MRQLRPKETAVNVLIESYTFVSGIREWMCLQSVTVKVGS